MEKKVSKNKAEEILFSWLEEVCNYYQLSKDVYSISFNLFKEIREKFEFPIEKFQLFGCSCLFLATKKKKEEKINVHNLCWISDYSFNIGQFMSSFHIVERKCETSEEKISRLTKEQRS